MRTLTFNALGGHGAFELRSREDVSVCAHIQIKTFEIQRTYQSAMTESHKLIDWDQVASLRDDVGEEDFADVITLFMEEVEEELGKLQGALSDAELSSGLHFLKGSALNIGFSELAELCSEGEHLAKNGQGSVVDVKQIVTTFAASKTAFSEAA